MLLRAGPSALRAKLGLKPLNLAAAETAAPGNSTLANDTLVAPVLPGEAQRTQEVRASPSIPLTHTHTHTVTHARARSCGRAGSC